MFGGGGLDPSKMKQMMDQMGIDLEELDASSVVITLEDGEELVFDEPDVTRMDARGEHTYQIIGDPETREAAAAVEGGEDDTGGDDGGIPQDDIELVAQRTGADEAAARDALEAENGDLAAAINRLE
ncbi:MAG: nascent polypeptide-associated complex protein [Halobacteriales archaeon]|nr:nascent polypeptide-associated complex protein [Halobacteriales archaeon]